MPVYSVPVALLYRTTSSFRIAVITGVTGQVLHLFENIVDVNGRGRQLAGPAERRAEMGRVPWRLL